MRWSAAFIALLALFGADAFAQGRSQRAVAQGGCPSGTYSIVNSPDGSTLSILFDNFSIRSDAGSDGRVESINCNIQTPLNLPEGYTLGVYRVDYRGFSRLSPRQYAELSVDYALGPRSNGRRFHRRIQGAQEGEFLFTENIGAGLMRRVGCGEAAVLNVTAALELHPGAQTEEAMAALDSVDGAPRGGLTYHFNLRRCRR